MSNMDNKDNEKDIYFERKYADLCLLSEEPHSEVMEYVYEDENGSVRNLCIKRPVEISADDGKTYYDITTPYGYGGPVIKSLKVKEGALEKEVEEVKKKLLQNFDKDFRKTCEEQNIIAEFTRFHPLINNEEDFKEMYNPIKLQNTIATRCGGEEPAFNLEFSSSARNKTRKRIKRGMSAEIITDIKDLTTFKEIYYETMHRKDAKDFYYFSDEYFQYVIDNFKNNVVLVNAIDDEKNIVAGSEMYFVYGGKYAHLHLSGTRGEYLSTSPTYLMRATIVNWADEHGYKLVHYGGGTTSSPEDPLYTFKKQFSKSEPFHYYIAKRILNEKIYDEFVKKTNKEDVEFFPKYRG